jgi:hypothetical protein
MTALRQPIDWRQCDFISLTNAGRVAGKSAAWARGAVCTGDLEAVRLPNGGVEVVTVKSLAAFLDRSHPVQPDEFRRTRPQTATIH